MKLEELDPGQLDRSSYVPLYVQLQEILKQVMESGHWRPGELLPSEHELCRHFGVSRNVVRQGLAILEDDRQIVRQRGRGTFVAEAKLEQRAGGLARLLVRPRGRSIAIQVIEARVPHVESAIRTRLAASPREEILQLTTLISMRGTPLALATSYLRRGEAGWLERLARPGRSLPPALTLADAGIELGRSEVAIETTRSGQFEADRFGIPPLSTVFLVLSTEFQRTPDGERPLEVARVEYRGDLLQFRLSLSPDNPNGMSATLEVEKD